MKTNTYQAPALEEIRVEAERGFFVSDPFGNYDTNGDRIVTGDDEYTGW